MDTAIEVKNKLNASIKVSVIIPVYNTQDFVEEAVRSIMSQTLQEIEIIIINDGSTDNSLQVVEKLAEEDSRIQIYSQLNQGQSVARNIGIKIAKGIYIYFMDSDDLLESKCLELCYNLCNKRNLDFVFFDADILNKDNTFSLSLNYQRKEYIKENTIYNGIELLNQLLSKKCYTPSPCLSLINKNFILDRNILFYPNIIHEDQLFSSQLYLFATHIAYIPQDFFKRRLRSNSTMTNQFSMRNMTGYFTVTDQLLTLISTHKEFREIIDKYLSQMLNAAIWLSYQMPFNDRVFVAYQCIIKYKKYVTFKNILIMLFKAFLKK